MRASRSLRVAAVIAFFAFVDVDDVVTAIFKAAILGASVTVNAIAVVAALGVVKQPVAARAAGIIERTDRVVAIDEPVCVVVDAVVTDLNVDASQAEGEECPESQGHANRHAALRVQRGFMSWSTK